MVLHLGVLQPYSQSLDCTKWFAGNKNTLAYYEHSLIKDVKSFITLDAVLRAFTQKSIQYFVEVRGKCYSTFMVVIDSYKKFFGCNLRIFIKS
jgi:hypothetical protein